MSQNYETIYRNNKYNTHWHFRLQNRRSIYLYATNLHKTREHS